MWKHSLSTKWIIFLSAITLSTLVLGSYAQQPMTVSLEVKEPLEILTYPSALSVYPGQTIDLNVTIRNSVPITYNVTLDFALNDTAYQAKYVTFSNTVYTVPSGETTLAAWLTISSSAPAAQFTLTVETNRGEQSSPQPFTPTQTLFGAGARWAAKNGSSALLIDWFDNFNAHYYTDGANWGPWWQKDDLEKSKVNMVNVLTSQGFTVECTGDVPQSLSKYDLVIFDAWFAIEPKHNQLVRDYLANGGNVVIMAGTPCYFVTYCKDMWPYRTGGMDLSSMQDWFGSSSFANTGGSASVVVSHPLGTSLSTKDCLISGVGGSCYSVVQSSLSSNSHVVALWDDSLVFAFTHEYGEGRVYYQAVA